MFWDEPFPGKLRDQWTCDLTAADLRNRMYMYLLNTPRLENIVGTLARLEYDYHELMEEIIAELLTRTNRTTS